MFTPLSSVGRLRSWSLKRLSPAFRRGAATVAVALVAAGGWSGCASTGGDYTYVTRISTGERMTFPLERGQPALAKSGTLTVRQAALIRGANPKEKKVRYEFIVEDKSGATPKAVRVEDVSEKTAELILEDLNPATKDNFWHGLSTEMTGYEPLLGWLSYLDSSTRVFRFTITTADGRQVVLYQAWMVPAFVKDGVRAAIGMKV